MSRNLEDARRKTQEPAHQGKKNKTGGRRVPGQTKASVLRQVFLMHSCHVVTASVVGKEIIIILEELLQSLHWSFAHPNLLLYFYYFGGCVFHANSLKVFNFKSLTH